MLLKLGTADAALCKNLMDFWVPLKPGIAGEGSFLYVQPHRAEEKVCRAETVGLTVCDPHYATTPQTENWETLGKMHPAST